jgi:hypothetical protein
VLVAVTTATLAAVGIARRRNERAVERLRADLLADASEPSDRHVTAEDLTELPEPVRRYFDTVLGEGRRHVRSVRIEQRGEIDLGRSSWKPFDAVQHFAVDPPGFVWDARVGMFPGVSARVIDSYVDGEGSLRATVCSVLPVVDTPPEAGMNEGELLRYLGECVWFPTALLPTEGVEWEAIDGDSARATIRDGETTASLVFQFDGRDLIERVRADGRYRQEDDAYAPWTGHFREYRVRNGVLVPTEAAVEWDPPAGEGTYWRAEIESIEYDVATQSDRPTEP